MAWRFTADLINWLTKAAKKGEIVAKNLKAEAVWRKAEIISGMAEVVWGKVEII